MTMLRELEFDTLATASSPGPDSAFQPRAFVCSSLTKVWVALESLLLH